MRIKGLKTLFLSFLGQRVIRVPELCLGLPPSLLRLRMLLGSAGFVRDEQEEYMGGGEEGISVK